MRSKIRLITAFLLVVALAVPVLSPTPALAADTDYDFSNLTIRNRHDAFYCDVDSMSASGPDVNSKSLAYSQYKNIAASDDLRWRTSGPGSDDEVFMWFDMLIAETPASITNIALTFEGYCEGSGDSDFEIWAYDEAHTDWDQIGTKMSITTGSDDIMTRSITSGFADYIDGSGLLRWGVYCTRSDERIQIDYAEAVVTGSSATYNFCFPSAYYCGVDSMSASGPALTIGMGGWENTYEANGEQYKQIAASDDLRWQTGDPGKNDYVFMWFDMVIAETPTNIELTFEGYGEVNGTFEIWADNTTDGWDKIGAGQEVTTGTDYTVTRSISGSTNCANYIDGSGLLRWGVFFNETEGGTFANGYWVTTDYAEAVVTGSSATYNFCFSSAYYLDEDDAPPLSWWWYDRQAYGTEYIAIAASDDSRWQTPEPGSNDEVFLWFGMVIAETPGDITNIELWFEGYGDATGNFQIYAYNNNTSSWDTIGSSESITGDKEKTFHRSISSDWAYYINGCGLLRWGVYYEEDDEDVWVDYVKAVVTVRGPDINIDKYADEASVAAGETIHYNYDVTNNIGLGAINSVVVTDDTPGCTSPAYVSGDAGIIGTLEDGETWHYECSYVTTMADLLAGSVDNEATATGEDPDTNPVEGTDTETVTVTRPTAEDNPALAESCGMDVVLVLDSSDSIGDLPSGGLDRVRNPAYEFVNAFFAGSENHIGVVEFDDDVVMTNLQDLTDNKTDVEYAIAHIADESSTQYTNWAAGLTEARKMLTNADSYTSDRNDAEHPDLIILISNGDPNRPIGYALDAAIIAANAAKSSTGPIRIIYVGVDSSTTSGEQVSGPNVADPPGVEPDIFTDAMLADFPGLVYVKAWGDAITAQANVCPGTITAHKFNDLNGNGIQDVDEGDLEGWTMTLYSGSGCTGGELDFGTTDSDGNVTFPGLTPGDYSVKETLEDGWANTTDLCQNVTLSAGGSETLNFGNRGALSISGMKFNDLDGEGDKDAGEPGLDGWEINLSGDATGTTTTAGGGLYSFDNLEPGTYTVSETLKAGWTQTYPTAPGTHTVILTDTSATHKDFGNWQPGTIIVEKVTVPSPDLVTSFDFTAGGGLSPSIFSLKNGQTKTFIDVPIGTYTVTETVPDFWKLTDITIVDPDTESSSTGAIATIDLDAGETVTCTFTNTFEPEKPPEPPPPPPAVGGEAYPVNKIAILAPWIALGALLAGGITWLTLKRRRA